MPSKNESSINKSIELSMEDDIENTDSNKNTSFPEAIRELGKALFERYPNKTSNYSGENEIGLLQADVLNDYMEKNFGYRFMVIDKLSKQKIVRTVSVKGYGIEKFIELVHGINIAFEQNEIPEKLRGILRR